MVGRIVPLATSKQNLAPAAAALLAQPTLARSTRRSYEQTLSRLVGEFGGDRPLSALGVEAVTAVVTAAWSRPGAADLEPARRHRPFLLRVLPATPLAHR